MSGLLLLVGDDLLVQRELERRLEELGSQGGGLGGSEELTVDRFDAVELEQLPELRTASLFGGRTIVIIRGVQAGSKRLREELEAYVENPSPDAVLILTATGTGAIRTLASRVKQQGERVDVRVPADWDDRGWERLVGEEFRRRGRKADATAIAAIRSRAGEDPGVIAAKVATVCAAAATGATITAAEVEAAVDGHGRRSGFAVADAVAERDPAAALVALRGALEGGEAPLAILGALTFRFRQLLAVRAGAGPKDVGASVGQHRRLGTLTRRFNPGELAWCHDRLAALDLDLKGSDLPAALLLEIAVLEVARSREVGAPFNPLAVG